MGLTFALGCPIFVNILVTALLVIQVQELNGTEGSFAPFRKTILIYVYIFFGQSHNLN